MSKRGKDQEVYGEGQESGLAQEPLKVAAAPAEFPMTVDEFCKQFSVNEKRVEILGAFYTDEKRHGRIKDTRSAYLKRFEEFCKRPV